MKPFFLSAVVLGLATMTQHTNAEVFVFTPPISHTDYITISPRIESKSLSDSLKKACSTNQLKLVTATTALNNQYKSDVACDIDLNKAKTTGQNCPITRRSFAGKGSAPCGRAEIRAKFETDGTKRIFVTVVYAFSGIDKGKVDYCLPFDPSSVPSTEGGMTKRWNVEKSSKTFEFICPK
ncbi:hypothetical protein EC957_006427 [Mortierella hygrophila]|uniref:Uncharacterized protein n=1 Tax=Mortierella hygrophila TaxID=979708 RepID=A0A9P6EZN7_9FUNG|nr:hypothetical protein EC957_006427 [Mortierella hygrophila]